MKKFATKLAGVLSFLVLAVSDGISADPVCALLAQGPTVWLPLNSNADDLVSGNPSALSGGPTFVAGKVGGALAFDKVDDAVRVPASGALDIGSGAGATVEMWMSVGDINAQMAVVEWSEADGAQLGLHLFTGVFGPGSIFANLIDVSGNPHHISTPNGLLSAGTLHHVALTYDKGSGVARFYIDGVDVAQSSVGNIRLETRTGLWLGQRVVGTTSHNRFGGLLDEVSFYDRALSAGEIQSIHSAGSLGKCTEPVLPSIFSQPSNQSVLPGENCSFAVTVVGTPPLTFQWMLGDTTISGATNSVFQILGVATNQGGAYSVVVQNSVGSVTSAVATLTVNLPPPTITLQPKPLTVLTGQTASFSIDALGILDLSYQWYRDIEVLVGQTNKVFEFAGVSTNDVGQYWATVSNVGGSVTSQVAVLTVVTPSSCLPVPVGTVAWWSFEGSGHDSAGQNPVVFSGEPAFENGIAGRAIRLGVGAALASVPGDQSIDIGKADGFTIEGWIKPDSLTTQALLEWNNRAGAVGVHLYLSQPSPAGNGSGSLFANVFGAEGVSHWISTPAGLVVTGVWQHVALTFSKAAGSAQIFVNGTQMVSKSFGPFTPQTSPNYHLLFGHRIGGGVQFPFTGWMDEITLYSRSLEPVEVALIHAVGSGAKCSGGIAPAIVSNPVDRTAEGGSSVMFSVGVSGSSPLTYQWRFEGTPIEDATNGVFTIANVQFSHAGSYSVVVTNASGTAESANVVLVVTRPPTRVRVVETLGYAGADVVIPVQIVANGTENAAGFSISFNPAVLSFASADLGATIPSGAALIVNTNAEGLGRVGMAIALAAQGTLSEGTQTLVSVKFRVAEILNQTTLAIAFGDQPTLRQVSDASANVVPSTFVNGTLTIAESQFEADVAPRPNGNRSVTTVDWVQMGRYVARLDTITSTNEFQRADCAPRSTKGNGLLAASDWVQAGRYAVGLDPHTVLGGPAEELSEPGQGIAAASGTNRRLFLSDAAVGQGQTNAMMVSLNCLGDENAVSFSIQFDATKLRYGGLGVGGPTAGLTFNFNTNSVGSGRIGVAVAAIPGATLGVGVRELFAVKLVALAPAPATATIAFGNIPVPRDVSDGAANSLATDYAGATVSITEPAGPPLTITHSGDSILVTWTTNSAGFVLQATEGRIGSEWQSVAGVITFGDQKLAVVSAAGKERFFRLKRQ